jgi:hypothetical protein
MTKADIEGTPMNGMSPSGRSTKIAPGPLIDAILNCIGAQWGTEFDFAKLRPIAAIMARYDVVGFGWQIFSITRSLTNIQLAINRHSAGGHTMAARRWFSYRRHGSDRCDRSHFADGDRGDGDRRGTAFNRIARSKGDRL